MQSLDVVARLLPLILTGEKTNTIRWREATIIPGPLRFVCLTEPSRTAVVTVTRCTDMPLRDAADFVGKAHEWTDEIMLAGSVSGIGDFAKVWDGNSFVDGQVLTPSLGSSFVTDVDVAYEGLSGNAMLIYGAGSSLLRYTTYDGSNWVNGGLLPPAGVLGEVRWTDIAADPNSSAITVNITEQ